MRDFDQRDIANAFANHVNKVGVIKARSSHELYTSLVVLNGESGKSGGKKEYIYFDITCSDNIQMRRQPHCDGYSCFKTNKLSIKDVLEDFIKQYTDELHEKKVSLKGKLRFIEKLSNGVKQ